jgi:signal transduction histidine kinase
MKLFTKYSRINMVASIVIFLVASVAFYFTLRYVLINQIDEDLEVEEDEITTYVKKYNQLPESFSFSDQTIHFSTVQELPKRSVCTVIMTNIEEKLPEKFRQLSFGIEAGGVNYKADVSKPLEGAVHLLRSILLITLISIMVILLVSLIINRVLLKNLWRPFYDSINAMRVFRISNDKMASLPETHIEEFDLLNNTLKSFTENSRKEYLALKTFSENASHEFQTPIAIIRSKLDLLIQEEKLSEPQSKTLQAAYNAIEKLSRLNKSLLLLVNIGNNQYEDADVISLDQKLEEKLQEFQELWQSHSLQMNTMIGKSCIRMNKELLEILLNNLLSNAISHNYDGGDILISLTTCQLIITNTSKEGALDQQQLFKRFYKPSQNSSHNGLGLSIVKQIADVSELVLGYSFDNKKHSFTVSWSQL